MTIVYHVIGLEGCGHHGLEKIIVNILKTRKGFKKKQCINNFKQFRNIDNFKKNEKNIIPFLNNSIIYTDDSYPSSTNRTIEKQKNITKIHSIVSKHAEIKFLYLKRNIYNLINSHPGFDGGIIKHAKKMYEIQNYIENQIGELRKNNVEVIELNYEDIDKEEGCKTIATFISEDVTVVKNNISKHFKQSQKDYNKILDKKIIDEISNIFKLKSL